MSNEIAKYRFDSSVGEIHEYDKTQDAYLFLGTYRQYGITPRMREATKISKVEQEKEHQDILQNT